MTDLDSFWEDVFSGDAARIRHLWENLTDEEAQTLLDHLQRMSTEPGWEPVQQEAAATALRLIREQAQKF